jgi:cysteine synthase A
MRYDHILQTIGRTPVVRLSRLAPPHVELYAKVESFNPMGSIKDRMALAVIEDAEARGTLKPGRTVVEATSGNTGIALAMVCARKGYPLVIVMAENFSVERRRLMRFLGAKVVLTPAALKGSGMLAKARELAAAHGWFPPRQFENEANAEAHRRGTALEILEDFADAPLTHWVTGFGTGGTLRGVASVLRERSPQTRIVVCEPDNSPVLASGEPAPAETSEGLPVSHPAFRPHLLQGWSPDFVPEIVQRTIADRLIDRIVPVSGARALACARDLARQEGILAGTSAGGTLAGALDIARDAAPGSRILAMLPDTGERYLSTPLFADIEAEMDADEWAISRSSPGWRFDAPPPAAPAAAPAVPVAASPEMEAFVADLLEDARQPVLMFALEWCEFCWTVLRFFKQIGVSFRSIDLDSVQYQAEARGQRIRAALNARTGINTIPQIFVAGRFVGGCMDTLASWDDGRMQEWLRRAGIPFHDQVRIDTRALLPNWVHPR